MQPKRDPADRRFWPARLGGTGKGFTTGGKLTAHNRYGALSKDGSLTKATRPIRQLSHNSMVDQKAYTAAIKEKAAVVTLQLLDRMGETAQLLGPKELPSALAAAGRLADVSSDSAQSGRLEVVVRYDGDAGGGETAAPATARLLYEGADDAIVVEDAP